MSDPREVQPGDVAIIGVSCRFPGARDRDEFWSNLVTGRESVTFFDDDSLDVDETLRHNPAYVRAYGRLDGYDEFDAPFFGISDRVADLMTPEHRLLLQSTWEAMEDGGYDPRRFDGEVGVYASGNPQTAARYMSAPDWVSASPEVMDRSAAWLPDALASNALYYLGLQGDAMTVTAVCSGFHYAVHLACQSLLLGQTDMALAGGVMVRLPHHRGHLWEEGRILSRDGHCRPFDAHGTGSVLASGVATLLLKPLDAALADRDHVHAVVKGTGINNNGASAMAYGLAQPERLGACIAGAMALGDVEPETVTMLEANGFGLPITDSLEVQAAEFAFGKQSGTCAIGSVKGNIGHAGVVAGGSGTLKAMLALAHRTLPPTINLTEENPEIDFPATPFVPQREAADWDPACGVRRAGVTALGGGGYNAHLVLQEAPPVPERPAGSGRPRLATLSAPDDRGLHARRESLRRFLSEHPQARVEDVCLTLNLGRASMARRWAAVVASRAELVDALAGDGVPGTGGAPAPGADPADRDALHALAGAWVGGGDVDLAALHADGEGRRTPLPTYPFARTRHWRRDW